MATTPSSKQSKSAKSRRNKHEDVSPHAPLPLVVDPTALSVMDVERLDPQNAEQLLSRSTPRRP